MNGSLLERLERAIGLLSGDEETAATATTSANSSPSTGGKNEDTDGAGPATPSSVGAEEKNISLSSTSSPHALPNDPSRAVSLLEELQQQVAEHGVFSSNEPLREVSTSSLPLLAVEHYLALGWTRIPWSSTSLSPQLPPRTAPGGSNATPDPRSRQAHLLRACDLWSSFLRRLEGLELLSSTEARQLDDLEQLLSVYRGDGEAFSSCDATAGDGPGRRTTMGPPPLLLTRDEKVARFRARQELAGQQQRLKSLRERRDRLGAKEDDEFDGYDGDGLARSIALTALHMAKADAVDEFGAAIQELPMVSMMIQAQQQDRSAVDPSGRYPQRDNVGGAPRTSPGDRSGQPLQVTRVTKDALGQLQVKREEIRSGVFRPGWNQPTQSLEELAEREVRDALEREERQRTAEADAVRGPRRYDQLVKDGMEDDADLVDASAALDRKWDDWKDENPRGSGNKRGNVGDRNF